MRFKKYLLNEIFNNPVDYKIKENSEDKFIAEFSVGDYNFIFSGEKRMWGKKKKGGRKLPVYGWEISFINTDYNTQGVLDELGKNAIKVFSTVLDIIENLIIEKETKFIALRAKVEEKSRVKLYRKMIERLKNRIEEYTEKQEGNELVYKIELKNK